MLAGDGFVVFRLGDDSYALPCECVEGLARPDRIHAVPGSGRWVLGVAELRGRETPVIDLRTRFGYASVDQEVSDFREMMAARQQDHVNWLTALETAVAEGREFTLARNPHECKFGRWYDAIRKQPLSAVMRTALDAFDRPHNAIHAIADEALAHAEHGEMDEAQAIISRTRDGELKSMVRLFGEVRARHEAEREGIVIVAQCGSEALGLRVDTVLGVGDLEEADGGTEALGLAQSEEAEALAGFRRRPSDKGLVMVLHPEALAQSADAVPELSSGADAPESLPAAV